MPGSGFPLETGDGPILLRLLCLDIGTDALLCMSQLGRGCSISLLWLRHPPRIDNARRSNRSCMILYVLIFRISVPPFYVWTTRRLRQRLWAFDHTFGNAFQSSHADARKPNLPKQNNCDASDIKIGAGQPRRTYSHDAKTPYILQGICNTLKLEILQHPATLILRPSASDTSAHSSRHCAELGLYSLGLLEWAPKNLTRLGVEGFLRLWEARTGVLADV